MPTGPAEAEGEDILELPRALGEAEIRLLMAEFDHLGASLLSNEETGERRVNVLLTIIAAVTAAIGLAANRLKTDADVLASFGLAAAGILLLYGLLTLRRLMERNVATTGHLNGLRRIRAFFALRHPELVRVLPFEPSPRPHRREREPWWGLGNAGFLETVAAVNCALAAIAVGASVWLSAGAWAAALPAGVVGAAAAWLAQMWWTRRIYDAVTAKRADARRETIEWWRANVRVPDAPE